MNEDILRKVREKYPHVTATQVEGVILQMTKASRRGKAVGMSDEAQEIWNIYRQEKEKDHA